VRPLSPRHGVSSGCGWREVRRVRRVAANIPNKQSRTADKGWYSSLGAGRVNNNPSPVTKCFKAPRTWTDSLARPKQWKNDMRFDLSEIWISGANWIQLAQDRVQWRACVNTVMNRWVP
jgi:hypothetical protein